MQGTWRVLLKAIKGILTVLAAVVLLIEEWGWRPLTAFAAWIARWPPLARLEDRIRALSPRAALCLFFVPATLLFPIKLLALWLIHSHHAWLGIVLIVAAKVLGTALVGRLFIVCEPQLMTFAWFARALDWWRTTKLRIQAAMASSSAWLAAKRARRRLRIAGRRLWRRYDRR